MTNRIIALIGAPKETDKVALLLRQKQSADIIKLKFDPRVDHKLTKLSPDVVIILSGSRNTAYACSALYTIVKVMSPTKIIIHSQVKDADLMFAAFESGVNKFAIAKDNDLALCDALLKEIKKVNENNNVKRILAIGAHPDDVEIGCGGTIKKHKRDGDEVMILTLTKGAQGGDKAARQKESINAAKSLEAQLVMYDLEDTNLSTGADTIKSIEKTIREFQPSIIYTHSINDTHQDHRATHYATLVAARKIKQIYAYLAPSGTIDFHPRYFEHIEDYIDDKMNAINCFISQTMAAGRPYLTPSIISSTAEYWGRFSNYGMVEPFEVIRA